MSDNNVLTYAIKEVAEETDVPRCMSRVKSAYEYIKDKERDARTATIKTNKESISMAEVTKEIKLDMEHGQRPSLGIVSEENEQTPYKQSPYDNNELEK